MKNTFIITAFLFLTTTSALAIQSKSPIPFESIRKTICLDYDRQFVESCTEADFDISSTDINGDGTVEWFYSGPFQFGGAAANLGLHIFAVAGVKPTWKQLYYGHARTIEVLDKKHQGYHDLLTTIYGGTIETYTVLRWNGKTYQPQKNARCDYNLGEANLPKLCLVKGRPVYDARE